MNGSQNFEQSPNTARIIEYWLGGKHYYPIDVVAAKQFEKVFPEIKTVFKDHRAYIGRASRYIAKRLDQIIVFGAGLPTQGNVHEVLEKDFPNCRVLYTDNDNQQFEGGR